MPNDKPDHVQGHHKSITIIVNGRENTVEERELTYLEVVQLAFPGAQLVENIVYKVLYSQRHGGEEGSLVDSQIVKVKQGMIINVSKTDKS